MKRIITGSEMATFDKYTINNIGIPSLVLMERAALSCVDVITKDFDELSKIIVMCGPGNNGADGVAIARILRSRGYLGVSYYICGNESKYTEELKKQIGIAEKIGVNRETQEQVYTAIDDADLIVDAIFGIGIKRNPADEFSEAIMSINDSQAKVLSVDIPSGICADTGRGYEPHVYADYTVTFQYIKKGHLLGEGYIASDNLTVSDIGITPSPEDADDFSDALCYMLEDVDASNMVPQSYVNDNKGTKGKLLVIAGSETIYGALYLAAKSAYRAGCGMVKVYTHENNMTSIKTSLPEALFSSYSEYDEDELKKLIEWPDAILIGPGLSTSETAKKITRFVLSNAECPVVADADAINIIAEDKKVLKNRKCSELILTPHLKEMSRLCGKTISEIECSMESSAREFCSEYNTSMILKNYTSYIYTDFNCYISTAGNEGLATAGSGDVLAGITASLIAQHCIADEALALATYIHGKAGEKASEKNGIRNMMASDIIEFIGKI